MKKIQGEIIWNLENNVVGAKFESLIDSQLIEHTISRQNDAEWPFQTWTATTSISDWIGNITEICGDKCSVKGVYRGCMTELHNITMYLPTNNIKVGERVMVTEHVDINGKFRFIATKRRVIFGNRSSSLTYINVGWSDKKRSRFLRIDPYTGEYKQLEGPPDKSSPMSRIK